MRGVRLGQTGLAEALAAGCVPVVVADSYVLPYADVLDWKRAVLQIHEENLVDLMEILAGVSPRRLDDMRRSGRFIYDRYRSISCHQYV